MGQREAEWGVMETQRCSTFLVCWSLLVLLLGLVTSPVTAQTPSYQEAALRAVDDLNRQSSDANLYRLLKLNTEPMGSREPGSPKPISFLVKETVCPRTTRKPPEQCDFKANGVVKQCVGTVTLDQVGGSFDVSCDEPRRVKLFGRLPGLIQESGQKIAKKIKKIGQTIKDFFKNLRPRQEES